MATQSDLIQHVLRQMAHWGVQEACLAAGARNAPLVAALAGSEGLRTWSFFEERCAAFFALGRTMVTHRPVAVVTTSGTAAAELLPAVIEAHYQGRPLLLITADRPRAYRETGAPQAIEQVGLFGPYVGACYDLEVSDFEGLGLEWDGRRPLHLNLCLDEPLDPAAGIVFESSPPKPVKRNTEAVSLQQAVEAGRPTLVLAGGMSPEEGALAAEWIEASGLPVVAEATANLGCTPTHAWAGGDKLLAQLQPSQVIRIGGVPSWRWWRDLESLPEVRVVQISSTGLAGLARDSVVLGFEDLLPVSAEIAPVTGAPLAERWASALDRALDESPLSEPAWVRRIGAAVPDGGMLMVGNSLPIRELSLVGVSPRVRVYANRGANGIDGQISTFLGTAVDATEAWLVIGDLTALYDLAAPWILRQMPAGRRRIVVINNGGGRIFSRVKSLRSLPSAVRGQIENRHDVELSGWAQIWGLPYVRVESLDDFETLPDRDCLIEVRPDDAQGEAFWKAFA